MADEVQIPRRELDGSWALRIGVHCRGQALSPPAAGVIAAAVVIEGELDLGPTDERRIAQHYAGGSLTAKEPAIEVCQAGARSAICKSNG